MVLQINCYETMCTWKNNIYHEYIAYYFKKQYFPPSLTFVYFLNSREIHSLFMQSQTGQTSVSRERESLSLAPSCVSKAMLLLCTLLNMRSMQITNHCTIHVWVLTIKLLLAAASVIVIACSQVTRTIERK